MIADKRINDDFFIIFFQYFPNNHISKWRGKTDRHIHQCWDYNTNITVPSIQWSQWNLCHWGNLITSIVKLTWPMSPFQSECNGFGGQALGTCALGRYIIFEPNIMLGKLLSGFGTCCVLSSNTCGGTITRNITYIRYNWPCHMFLIMGMELWRSLGTRATHPPTPRRGPASGGSPSVGMTSARLDWTFRPWR